ncbi:uncharacterized protein N7458_000560 [Penicillium daleae]|uniref:Uncharacterized protein n=1 Tax=Penicillium daleae TaxID=63821 RepID=A0AAD6CJ34_9EURO|nr:uncharacterized protein N7458_000560 [Penicillium daleae]KAJ5464874.1 hypothetical protein N7458_000560 [Penicillium daleae]
MQFYAVLLPVAALLATTASAADCYPLHGSHRCVNSNDLLTNREYFTGANGHHGVFTSYNVPTQQACWDSLLDIIDQCLGHRNGGTYSLDGWSMEINFCA